MNEINNINPMLHEHKNDEDINDLFYTILTPNHKDIFLKLFLQSEETKKRCMHSKNIFIFLLTLPKILHDRKNIINFTNSFNEFLSEIQESQYLYSNFHFISRSVQQILEYVFLNHEFGSFCLISYKARLLGLEFIPVLPLFFIQDQNIEQISSNYLFYIQSFLSKYNESFLIWCYIENMHNFFCKIIDKSKEYSIDQFSESIIQERIETTKKFTQHTSTLFIEFLSLMYPSISLKISTQHIIQKSNSIDWISNFDKNDDYISTISRNINQYRGFIDPNPPYKNIRHLINFSKLQLKTDFSENSPKSLPPPRKKLLKVQTRPKFELKIIPSIAERFKDSDINIQGKILVKNYELPSNFKFKDFNSTLNKLTSTGTNDNYQNQGGNIQNKNDKNYIRRPPSNRFNKAQFPLKLKTDGIDESKKSPKYNKDQKGQTIKNNINKYIPASGKNNHIDLISFNNGHNQKGQALLNKKNIDDKETKNLKDKNNEQGSKLNVVSKNSTLNNILDLANDDDQESESEYSTTSESESESESDEDSDSSKDSQNNIECNLSSYPSSNPPSSQKKMLLRKKPLIILSPPKDTNITAINANKSASITATNNNSPNLQHQQQNQNQPTSKIVIQKRNCSNNISIQKNSSNQSILDKQSTKP